MLSTVRLAALAAVPVLGLALAGCGVREQTQIWYAPADGTSAEAGDIGIRNTLVVAEEPGDKATLLVTFANSGADDDELQSVRVGDADAVLSAPVDIPAHGYGRVGYGQDETRVDVDGSGAEPGQLVEIEFVFGSAPRTTVEALVQSARDVYADAFAD